MDLIDLNRAYRAKVRHYTALDLAQRFHRAKGHFACVNRAMCVVNELRADALDYGEFLMLLEEELG